jgi:amino acid adenylation domain-containing protein
MARSHTKTAESIQAWLVEQLADLLSLAPQTIDVDASFDSYGLSSREAIMLSGDLEEWLEQRLSPTLIYEYPTIHKLAQRLAGQQADADAGRAVAPPAVAAPTLVTAAEPGKRLDEPIAIVGLGCRFPGADGPDAFWKLLHDGVDAITEAAATRWDVERFYDPEPGQPGKMYTRWGGFLTDVDQFDAQFFGISPREAARTDPQQRLLLEVTWEALEHAGYAPDGLAGSDTAVYVGISSNDYSLLQYGDYAKIDAYMGTGNAFSIAANRLSYLLNLHGPSMAIDTACSSSLVAVHLACQALRSGESRLALAGGVNLILSPELNIAFSHAGMMSLTGRCRTFDADADGYVRGEGCGVVVLKRLSDALADGDNVLAVIRSTAVNQDGRSNGLTAPNGQAQQAVIRQALQTAGITPDQLGYVEAHGTGTKLGDPIEVDALSAVLRGRSLDNPCLLGSVKTNIGHLESAAGVAGLIKTALALHHGEIPPHLHFKQVNPYIHLDELPLKIPTAPQPWPTGEGPRYAGVSSFGFGGTNAHIVLEEAPALPAVYNETERDWNLLTLSARDERVLTGLAGRYADYVAAHPESALADISFTANTGRNQFAQRLAVSADSLTTLQARLSAFANGEQPEGVHLGQVLNGKARKIAFLFTGQGAQYAGMGRTLYETQPVFRAALDRCAAILDAYLERPLLSVIFAAPDSPEAALIHATAYTQPALFAIEYALAQLWQSWGIRPDVVMGHSIGEYVAACLAGIFSLEDGLKLIAARGRLMQSLPQDGEMAVVFAEQARVKTFINGYTKEISVAAVNGPTNTVIAGKREAVQAAVAELTAAGITVRPLIVSHAFHSPLMDPILGEFLETARTISYQAPQLPFISNLTGRLWNPEVVPDAVYWQRHIRHGVQFASGMEALAEAGCQVFVEIGPHPSLLNMGRRCLAADYDALWLPSLRRDAPDWPTILDSLATAHTHGLKIDWAGFHAGDARRRLHLPTYPFQRERHWLEPARVRAGEPVASADAHSLLGRRLPSPLRVIQYAVDLGAADLGTPLLPATAVLEMALSAAAEHLNQPAITLAEVAFPVACRLPADAAKSFHFIFDRSEEGAATFELHGQELNGGEWTLYAAGRACAAPDAAPPAAHNLDRLRARGVQTTPSAPFRETLTRLGLPADSVTALWLTSPTAAARRAEKSQGGEALLALTPASAPRFQHLTPLLEIGFQALGLTYSVANNHAGGADLHLPVKLDALQSYGALNQARWAHVIVDAAASNGHGVTGSVALLDESGQPLLSVQGLALKPADADARQALHSQVAPAASASAVTAPASGAPETAVASAQALTAESLRALAPAARFQQLESYLRAGLAHVLGLDAARIDLERPINFFGLDSIMAIELKNRVEKELNVNLPVAILLQGPTLTQLTAELASQLDGANAQPKIIAAQTGPGEYPLSYGQRALWIQHQIDPGSVFNPRYAVRIHGDVDAAQMRQTFQALIDRHAALRTTFVAHQGEPVQIVHAAAPVSFTHVDAAGWSAALLEKQIEEAAYEPFDLVNGPLFRIHLFSLSGADGHVLLLAAHHIVVDMWSLAVLINELSVLLTPGATVDDLAKISVAYTDYVEWHNGMLTAAEGEQLWSYWRKKLQGRLPILELPTDHPRPAVQTHNGAAQTLQLDAGLTRQLEALSERYGVTLYVTLLAAFNVLLHRYAQQEEIIVGTPTTGRSLSELTDLVGYLVNPVPLRTHITADLHFTDLLKQVQQTVVEAINHQDYPIALLVEKLQPERRADYLPLFQVMFIMQRAHLLYEEGLSKMSIGAGGTQMTLGDLTLESVSVPERLAPFDLTLMAAPTAEGIAAAMTYNTDLFDAATIARMLAQYQTLLTNIVKTPESAIAALSLLPPEELEHLLVAFNATRRESKSLACCVHDLFIEQVRARPEATAVVFDGQSLTYAELNQRANQLANYLQKLGVGPETMVGICVERSLEMVVGLLGILKAGGAYLPMDPNYPPERLTYMATDARVAVLLAQQKVADVLPPTYGGQTVYLDSEWHRIAQQPATEPQSDVDSANLAYVIYTSGSTGRPKGVLLTHGGLCNLVQAQTEGFGISNRSHVLQFASFSFDASVSEVFMALLRGGTLHLARHQQLAATQTLHDLLRDEGITAVTLPPSMLAAMPTDGLEKLQTIISAGEALPSEIAARWISGRRLFNAYGPTEATIGPTYYRVKPPLNGHTRVPIGQPIANMQIYLLNEQLQPAPIGVPGELHIGGVGLARGYLNQPDLTAQKFIPNPFSSEPGARLYKTGDLARYRPDGNIEFLGRIDHQVKLRGFRIELGEIESALLEHPAVTDCITIVREDKPGDQRLVSYIVANQAAPSHPSAPNTSQLRSFLQNRLPEFMLPSNFVVLPELPKTPNGKVDRRGLPAPTSERPELETQYVHPRTEAERALAAVWQEVLGIDRVGVNDNFFDLGGHSLLAAKVHSRLQERFNRQLTMVELFRYPSVRALAEFLANEDDEPATLRDVRERAQRQRQALKQQRQEVMQRARAARRRH